MSPYMYHSLSNQVEADQPGSTAQGRKERILRAAISARDRLCDAKTHCEALLRSSASRSTPGAGACAALGQLLKILVSYSCHRAALVAASR